MGYRKLVQQGLEETGKRIRGRSRQEMDREEQKEKKMI